jgi:glycosyltransferase involved in cell wall biosynthesis
MPIWVTVIATVMNEGAAMSRLLDSLKSQSRQPDQIIIVDGGSTDDTVDVIHAHPLSASGLLKLVVSEGANISKGRNVAIRAASDGIIAATDAGVRLEPDWLERLIAPFDADDPPDVVSGFFVSDPGSVFEMALGATTLPDVGDIAPAKFLHSSRSVAFRRAAWVQVGGYPEWLDYCEDLLFDFALRDAGTKFRFEPQALVHFRPRVSLASFFKQYYRYARGDGKADIWRLRHGIRYGTYLVAAPLFLALATRQPWFWLVLLAGAAAMLRTPYRRLRPKLAGLGLAHKVEAIAWVPLIRITGDIAKMVGYLVGLRWRAQHRADLPD